MVIERFEFNTNLLVMYIISRVGNERTKEKINVIGRTSNKVTTWPSTLFMRFKTPYTNGANSSVNNHNFIKCLFVIIKDLHSCLAITISTGDGRSASKSVRPVHCYAGFVLH